MGELVTCIVDEKYDPKKNSKGRKRRAIKKNIKEEEVQETIKEAKELKQLEAESPEVPTTLPNSSKKAKKSRKALRPKQLEYSTKQKEVEGKVKMEEVFKTEIEKILQYSKKPKSKLDMDFTKEKEEKKPRSPRVEKKNKKKSKKISNFREYLEWVDLRWKAQKNPEFSRGGSTTLSTPLKRSLRISQRIANAHKMR